jgi:hypothetical protein
MIMRSSIYIQFLTNIIITRLAYGAGYGVGFLEKRSVYRILRFVSTSLMRLSCGLIYGNDNGIMAAGGLLREEA